MPSAPAGARQRLAAASTYAAFQGLSPVSFGAPREEAPASHMEHSERVPRVERSASFPRRRSPLERSAQCGQLAATGGASHHRESPRCARGERASRARRGVLRLPPSLILTTIRTWTRALAPVPPAGRLHDISPSCSTHRRGEIAVLPRRWFQQQRRLRRGLRIHRLCASWLRRLRLELRPLW